METAVPTKLRILCVVNNRAYGGPTRVMDAMTQTAREYIRAAELQNWLAARPPGEPRWKTAVHFYQRWLVPLGGGLVLKLWRERTGLRIRQSEYRSFLRAFAGRPQARLRLDLGRLNRAPRVVEAPVPRPVRVGIFR